MNKGILTNDTIAADMGVPTRKASGACRLGLVSAPEKDPELQAGDVLEGRYALLSPLGEGGMGDVWLAHNAALDIKVALKVLRVDDNHPERKIKLTQRLLQEARATAMLGHPAIVRITDFGMTVSGNGFVVMELLDGEDLWAFLDRHGRLSAVKAVRTLLPIAHALVAAHAKKIVHRDLKPENIFLARNDDRTTIQPKLIDFGVAKLQKVADERITIAGAVLGSPGYMAPEQARGEDVDERADVWGFSVVLYETITGRLPFEGKNYNALMRSIIEDKPAPVTSFGVGDYGLSAIIDRGLAKDPDSRWQTMRDMGVALAQWLTERLVTEDICGGQLGAIWIRGRVGADLARSSAPPALHVWDAAIPSAEISFVDAASRRERGEAQTVALSAELDTAAERAPLATAARSTRLTISALALAAIGCIVLGVWSLRTPDASAAPAKGAVVEVGLMTTQGASAPSNVTVSVVASAPIRANAAPPQPKKARPIAPTSLALTPLTAAPKTTANAPSRQPQGPLKNPF